MNSKHILFLSIAIISSSLAFTVSQVLISQIQADQLKAQALAEQSKAEAERAKFDKDKASAELEIARINAEKAKFEKEKAEEYRKTEEFKLAAEEKEKFDLNLRKYLDNVLQQKHDAFKRQYNFLHSYQGNVPINYPQLTKMPSELSLEDVKQLLEERNRLINFSSLGYGFVIKEFGSSEGLKSAFSKINKKLKLSNDDFRILTVYPDAS